jgi:O-antigen/teichoic acid export membrane protein
MLPLAAVTHYVTPFELVTKLLIIPTAVVSAAFPVFAGAHSTNPGRLRELYARSQRAVVVLIFPVVLVTIALAHEGLAIWLRGALPPESATVLQWLAAGMFINSIAYTPFVALQGAGRADLIAKLHVAELPIYAALIWYLAHAMGLVGVAVAWTLRVAIDSSVLVILARRVLPLPRAPRSALPGIAGLGAVLAVAALPGSTGARIMYAAAGAGVFVAIAWRRVLSGAERAGLVALFQARESVVDSPTGLV